ncbi:MAG TPA: hypothetical protein VJR29_08750 [bacterium]|nr:hypothetical protein [bacterium]
MNWRMILAFFGLFTWPAMSFGQSPPSKGEVRAQDGLICSAYFFSAGPSRHLILTMGGTGLYSNLRLHGEIQSLLKTHPVSYVIFDKPGIQPKKGGKPGAYKLEDEPSFLKHTQDTLMDCAAETLRWGLQQGGGTVQAIHLRGHSEGSQIALRLYERLLKEKDPLAAQVQSLLLTGLPIEPWDEIVSQQLQNYPEKLRNEIQTAMTECDWKVLKKWAGVPCGYLRKQSGAPSNEATLEGLRLLSPKVPIYVFHGLNDAHVSAGAVKAFERKNAAHRERNEPSLDFRVLYYEGGHRSSESVRGKLKSVLQNAIPPFEKGGGGGI